MSKSKRRRGNHSLRQVTAYLVSGGAYFWSGYIWLFIADRGLHWPLFWSSTSANLLGITINFLLQHYWVFAAHKTPEKFSRITYRYGAVTIVDIILNYFVLAALQRVGIIPEVGQFVSAGFFTFWNYYWYKYWVFTHRPSRSAAKAKPAKA